MLHTHAERLPKNRVIAVFEASALVFELPRAASLEQLAERLAWLSERQASSLLRVEVKLCS
ncbi:MAG TPA: hypothetical protein VFO74_02310 [Pseudolabrys sp.]|jgi:hypothetical protein|nr:hypothetical protein [Pseudolabrys sp.]